MRSDAKEKYLSATKIKTLRETLRKISELYPQDKSIKRSIKRLVRSARFPKIVQELNEALEEAVSTMLGPLRLEGKRLACKFIECAKDDIEVAGLLYEVKRYPQAVFYLQQAIEKAAKGYVMIMFNVDEKELKKIGHETPETFVISLKRVLKESWVRKLINVITELDRRIKVNGYLDELEKVIKDKKKEYARMSKTEISFILNHIEKSRTVLGAFTKPELIEPELVADLLQHWRISSPELNKERLKELLIESVKVSFTLASVSTCLGLLSIVTYPHSTFMVMK